MATLVNVMNSSGKKISCLIRPANVALRAGFRHFHKSSVTLMNEDTNEKPSSVIFCGVCIQRHPIITPSMMKMEEKFASMMDQMEMEESKYSDHEMRHFKDLERVELKRQGEEDVDDADEGIVTAMDMEDAWESELAAFQPAEVSNDVGKDSPMRMMDKKLLLVTEQTLGNQSHWVLPQTQWQPGESLRDTAERIVQETLPDSNVSIDGNAPVGVYKYSFTENGAQVPAKIFFYRAELKNPRDIEIKSDNKSLWLSSSEMSGYFHQKYGKTVQRFFLDL